MYSLAKRIRCQENQLVEIENGQFAVTMYIIRWPKLAGRAKGFLLLRTEY